VKILALDTTLGACSASVAVGGNAAPRLFNAFELREREHAEVIMLMIEKVMGDARLKFGDLDAIAATVGPGSFTGVRVGVAAARGLALSTGCPLIGISSLEVMAHQALEWLDNAPGMLGIAVDARRGEVYQALFSGAGETISPPDALTPDQAAAHLAETETLVLAGGGAQLVAQAAAANGRKIQTALPDLQPDAAKLASMALTRSPVEGPIHPLYLRAPDAKPQAGKSVPRRD